ncbi:MAG: hypothetical protein U1U88_001954 [Lawsonella clevelandensis]
MVSAAGVWAGHIDNEIKLRPARGTHLVIDAARWNPTGQHCAAAWLHFPLPLRHPRAARTHLLGLTDEETRGEIVIPHSGRGHRLPRHNFNSALEVKLTRDDVIGAFTATAR